MNPSLLLRLCVVFSVIFSLASAGVELLFTDLISPALASAIEKESNFEWVESHLLIFLAVAVPLLVANIAGVVGILFFKRWGRALALYSTLLGFFIWPFTGPVVSSGPSWALSAASITLWGAALALAYFSPAAERFKVGSCQDSGQPDPAPQAEHLSVP